MHELQITDSILKIVLHHADLAGAKQVVAIRLRIGQLSELEDEWIQRYFDHVSKDTIAHKALLQIEHVPIQLKCNSCQQVFSLEEKNQLANALCPGCAGDQYSVISGTEYTIEDIKVR